MNTRRLMLSTLAALIPGAAAMTWQFGPGLLLNLAFAAGVAVSTEALVMLLRRRSLASVLDGSALLTGLLIGLALPPLLPFWILTLGVVSGLVFGKHVYGGLGQNLFNPAMVGYAVLILSFPLAMSQWPAPYSLAEEHRAADVLRAKTGLTSGRPDYDGISRATPLDAYRFRSGRTNAEFFSQDEADNLRAWMTINLAFLVGGLLLAALRVIPWVIPAGFIATLSMLSLLFYDGGGSGSLGSPVFSSVFRRHHADSVFHPDGPRNLALHQPGTDFFRHRCRDDHLCDPGRRCLPGGRRLCRTADERCSAAD